MTVSCGVNTQSNQVTVRNPGQYLVSTFWNVVCLLLEHAVLVHLADGVGYLHVEAASV